MKKIILSILTIAAMATNANAQMPTAGLVGHYAFTNGALTDNINSVDFTKTGTASTNITDRLGNANEAISLNGDDLIRPDIDFDLSNSNPYLARTISFWMKTSTNDGNSRLIYNDNDKTSVGAITYSGLIVFLQNGQVKASNRVGSQGSLVTHSVAVNDNNWHHVAVQAYSTEISGTKRFYTYVFIDGVKEGGNGYQSSTSSLSVKENEHVGDLGFSRLKGASVANNQKYQDGIDEILFYTRILTDTEISGIATDTPCLVNIPDVNFKAYLVGNSAINTNGDTEIQCGEASAFTGAINCSSQSIADLTGIEAFTALTDLNCNNNLLTSLNINSNTNLLEFRCDHNSITVLDFSNNSNLLLLSCSNNSLIDLNLTANSALIALFCDNNSLMILNVANGNNTALTGFDATNNPNLTCITVDNVAYSTTNWTNVDAQTSFSTNCYALCTVTIPDANFKAYLVGNSAINTNGDTEIQCTEAFAFTGTINCNSLSITDLTGIEAFPALTTLYCYVNSLTVLDVSNNTNLTTLYCNNNNLTVLDVSNNTALTKIYCDNNSLTALDVSNNITLTYLRCNNNSFSTLNVANGNNTNFTNFNATNNPNLTCITVDNVAYSTTNWTNIDATASFSTTNCILVSSITVQGQAGAFTITTPGGTLQIGATVLPANAADGTYTWSVFNQTGSATIDANGLLTASTDGIVSVTATANDASGETGSMIVTITNQSTGINELNAQKVNIYPNPVKNQLFVEVEEGKVNGINILDVSGKTVKTINGNIKTIDVSDLTQGFYFLQLQTENEISNSKFIKE